jgi:hypothetical protein
MVQRQSVDGPSRPYRRLEADADSFPLIEPVYPLTAGLSPKVLRRSIEVGAGPPAGACQSGPIRTW